MLLPWMQKLIDSVPPDFVPELVSAREGESVKGSMPDDIARWYNASVWALREADRILDEHQRKHDELEMGDLDDMGPNDAKRFADDCLETRTKAEQLKNRAAVLGVAAKEALVEHFGLKADDDVEVRSEGVVVLEPVSPLSSLFSMLEDAGISVVRI